MTSVLVAVETTTEPQPKSCGRVGCDAPGVVTTVLCGDRKTWELHHCEAHPDGPGIALSAGFRVLGQAAA